MNFLEETNESLDRHNKTEQDIKFVANLDINYRAFFTWEEFYKVADFSYDPYASFSDIDPALIIAGHDWWLYRKWDEDSYCWYWEINKLPVYEEECKIVPDEYDLLNQYKHGRPFKPTFGGKSAEIITDDLSLSNDNE